MGVLVVPDVTDELVSLSSVFCDDRELVEPQSFLFSKKSVRKMRFEGSQVKAPPLSRRKMIVFIV